MKNSKIVLFRCDGTPEIGLGHVMRCLALAEELRDKKIESYFAMRKGPLGASMVEENGFQIMLSDEAGRSFSYDRWLGNCAREKRANAVVFDVRDGLSRDTVRELRNSGLLTVTIDDPEDKRLEMDLAFYPPVPQVKRMDWSGFTGELYSGWEWVILRKEFAEWRKKRDRLSPTPITYHPSIPQILITMGGSDPAHLTLKVVQALNTLLTDFHADIVQGPGFRDQDALNELLSSASYSFEIHRNVKNMVAIMAEVDLAIASFGVTAYELAAAGIPSIFLCLTEDHSESATAFTEDGKGNYMAVRSEIEKDVLTKEIHSFLITQHSASTQSSMAKIMMIGTMNIADVISNAVEDKIRQLKD